MLNEKKARALMVVIEMMIARYQNTREPHDVGIFRLFESAKKIFRAKNENELKRDLDDL